MVLTRGRLLAIRDACFADDLSIEDAMLAWDEEDVVAYFESNGAVRPVGEETGGVRSVYCISDIHVEHKQNLAWLDSLPDGTGGARRAGSVLLCGGDVAVRQDLLRSALRTMVRAYETVFFVPGNHDVWLTEKGESGAYDSLAKWRDLLTICDEEGVHTRPRRLQTAGGRGLWVLPIASWHHRSWDREPPLKAPPGHSFRVDPLSRHASSDDGYTRWPCGLEHGSEELAEALDALNDERVGPDGLTFGDAVAAIDAERDAAAAAGDPPPLVLTMSHFLPRQELVPEKRHLFMPTLHRIVGSDFLRSRVGAARPDVHYFGHTHFAWDQTLDDGVRYISWPLGSPQEQTRRVPHSPSPDACRAWLPLRLWDAAAGWRGFTPDCYFSRLYTTKGRHPERTEMAHYTAAIYCPNAPIDPMLSLGDFEQMNADDLHAARESMRHQLERNLLATGKLRRELPPSVPNCFDYA